MDTLSKKTFYILIAIALAVLLLPLLFNRWFFSKMHLSPEGCTEKVVAVVIQNERSETHSRKGGGPSVHYIPTYRFEYAGAVYTVRSRVGHSEQRYSTNSQVELLIDPDDPTHIYNPKDADTAETSNRMTAFYSLVLIGMGAFVVFGIKKNAENRMNP